jgi:tetratricopeptide (TPR) repeat protein
MARVSHPNILAVHDVGDAGGRVFLALELVDGATLAAWLHGERRPPREILERFVAAGRGLAAAHRAGLVHRDFKPENVLLSQDGRVLVADFGLAHLGGSDARGDRCDVSRLAEAPSLTATGAVLGTPAYMSPEQVRGVPADARSDQFSFCVALSEALHGEHPFRGATARELIDNVRDGRIAQPARAARVPPHVRRALVRGLATEPADRHASMDALLGELTRDTTARRRAIGVFALVLVVGFGAALAVHGAEQRRAEAPCTGAERKLVGIWDPARKRDIERAFGATGAAFAADAWHGTERVVDTWTGQWVKTHAEACEATHVRHEQSADLLDRRFVCLDERMQELRSLVEVLAAADTDVVRNAVGAAQSLARVDACSAAASLARPHLRADAPDARAAQATADARRDLAEAKALRDAGKYATARDVATRAARAADAIGDGPLRAAALYRRGELEGLTGDMKIAERSLLEAAWAADASRDDDTRARALSELLYVGSMNDPARMPFFRDESAAALARLGGELEIETLRASNFVVVLRSRGELDGAEVEAERALALASKLEGGGGRLVGIALHNLAGVLLARGDYPRARTTFERALTLTEQALGPSHPNVARTESQICQSYYLERNLAIARTHCARAASIAERALAADDPSLSDIDDNFGAVLVELREADEALRRGERALAIREKHYGARHRKLLYPLVVIGKAELVRGHPEGAVKALERALAVATPGTPPDDLADASFALARALMLQGAAGRGRARELAERAVSLYAAALGPARALDRADVEAWLDATRR